MGQTRVVLVGHNYNSILGLARVLGTEGYEVCAIRTGTSKGRNVLRNLGRMPEARSKYITSYTTASAEKDDEVLHILLNRFASTENKGVVFPVDDRCAEIIDCNYDRLSPYYYLPNVEHRQGGIMQLMDKHYQKILAKQADLSVPEGWSVEIKNGKYMIPSCVTFPCFVKSEFPMKDRKKYMCRCDNINELQSALDRAASYRDCTMLIEEFIQIEQEYCIVGLCNGMNVCIPEVIDETVMGHETHAGVTCFGRILDPSDFQDILEPLKRFLSGIGFQGLFTVDVMRSKDRMYFCELNMRMGASGIAVMSAGVNLADMLVRVFRGERVDSYDQKCNLITFANERPLISEYAEGYITRKEYRNYIRRADFRFIYSKDDKAPYYCYGMTVVEEMLRRVKRKYKH